MPNIKPGKTTRLLFVGNSFTQRNDLPALIEQMAASAPNPQAIETQRIIANGASLRQHWNKGEALQAIQESAWDYVVLQEQSTLPLKNAQRFHENVRLFDNAIKGRGARTVLYLTWARQNAPETQHALNMATSTIGNEVGALVVPVGPAWQTALRENPELELYDRDGSHPGPAGTYLAACVFVATLLGPSPLEIPVPDSIPIEAPRAEVLQRAAAQAAAGKHEPDKTGDA